MKKRTNINTKVCNKCSKPFDKSLFRFRKSRGYYSSKCKECEAKVNNKYYITNVNIVIKRTTDRRKQRLKEDNKYKQRVYSLRNTWGNNNKDKVSSYNRNWSIRNPGKKSNYTAEYRAAKLKATPLWLTKEQKEQIRQVYRDCPKGYEVDHIHPLQGKDFSGLHVPWNLQYLLMSENRSKSNKLLI